MSKAIDVDVLIGDRQYTIRGAEGSEYIQKIAAHINDKLSEFRQQEGYATLDIDMKNILLAINLSDDYYKAKQELEEVRAEYQEKEQEIFDMKHELVSMQSKMDKLVEETNQLREQQSKEEHSAIRMEAKYEHASQNEEKSRLELTRLEKRLKMIQDSEQRAQAKQKELEKELEEQKKLVQKLSADKTDERDRKVVHLETELQEKESAQKTVDEEQTKAGNAIIETTDQGIDMIAATLEETDDKGTGSQTTGRKGTAGTGKTQNKKSSRKSRRR